MTNKELFTRAHKIARETVKAVGDYMIAFKLALKEVQRIAVVENNLTKYIKQQGLFEDLKKFQAETLPKLDKWTYKIIIHTADFFKDHKRKTNVILNKTFEYSLENKLQIDDERITLDGCNSGEICAMGCFLESAFNKPWEIWDYLVPGTKL